MIGTLVLLRHGQSAWNAENRFTGWVDVGLTEVGVMEARRAGHLLAAAGIFPDVAHTSLLRRAITTTNLALEEAARHWIPVERTWRLNERHYGALAGLDKTTIADRYGAAQVHAWRRSYDVRPPALEDISEFRTDPRYADIRENDLPRSESLADVQARLLPYWSDRIVPQLESGRTVLLELTGTRCVLSSNTSRPSATKPSSNSRSQPERRASTKWAASKPVSPSRPHGCSPCATVPSPSTSVVLGGIYPTDPRRLLWLTRRGMEASRSSSWGWSTVSVMPPCRCVASRLSRTCSVGSRSRPLFPVRRPC